MYYAIAIIAVLEIVVIYFMLKAVMVACADFIKHINNVERREDNLKLFSAKGIG